MAALVSPHVFFWVSPALVVTYILAFRSWCIRTDRREWSARQSAQEEAALASFVPKALLTPNEKEFFVRLKSAAASLDLEVVPQVAMGALLDINLPSDHPAYWPLRRRFSQKIIDFVVYEKPSLKVLAVVELDDITHDPEKDRLRDAMMAQAGFRTVRWESRAKPSVMQIADTFSRLLKVSD